MVNWSCTCADCLAEPGATLILLFLFVAQILARQVRAKGQGSDSRRVQGPLQTLRGGGSVSEFSALNLFLL